MALQSSHLEYYDKMHELEERLRRSEEERMLLQRQFDHLLQSNQEKERARVSVVEARYKRFLDEDKRRRDRNSSLLQALDRIDSHTASLAAKTERMRTLRKHYEAFIAHSYPGWHTGIERSYCPLAAISPAPNVMTRVTDITGYDSDSPQCFPDRSDYSETQYHALPSIPPKPFFPLASQLCRSDLAIPSREDCPVVGRPSYRTGSAAIRSASLSPSRVRDLSSQFDADKISHSSTRNYDLYSPSKSPDVGLSPRLRNEMHISRRSDIVPPSRTTHYHTAVSPSLVEDKPYHKLSSTQHRFLDYDHGNSDVEVEQNTSGDLLNLSNLSLSDDGILNETEIHDSQPLYSGISHLSYSSARDLNAHKANPSISLSLPHTSVRHHTSPRDAFIPKRSGTLSPSIFASSSPKSILSPRSRKSDLASSLPLSDSVHRILLPVDDLDTRRSDSSLSPRRQKPTWQTLRPSYLAPPPRNTIRRSVTFTEPEYESPYNFRDEDTDLYSGSYGSLRRHSPSLPTSSWESSDHERFLREKQGREKDAFREKIERLKELIQENKDQEIGTVISSSQPKTKDYEQKQKSSSRDNSLDRDWKASQSRRPSIIGDLSSDSEDHLSELMGEINQASTNGDVDIEARIKGTGQSDDETVSEKEQLSGQFSEKDEDAKENVKVSNAHTPHSMTLDCSNTAPSEEESRSMELSDDLEAKQCPPGESRDQNNQDIKNESSQLSEKHNLNETYQIEPQSQSSDFIHMESQQLHHEKKTDAANAEKPQELELNDQLKHEKDAKFENDEQPLNREEKSFSEYTNDLTYEKDQQQQDWPSNEDNLVQDPQHNVQHIYEQGDPPSAGYEEQNQNGSTQKKESSYEQYTTAGEQEQQSYENYQTNANPQPQGQGDFSETPGYETYQESQQPAESGNVYPDYSEDPSQYQQNYQTYSEDQQYGEQQDQNYSTQDQDNYQYPQDSNKPQYEYEGQEYNYQQPQDTYDYPQDPNYQQDPTYQQDSSYQPEQSYAPDQAYPQDQPYPQETDFQQTQQYQETGYDGSQQYEGYQPGTDDLSEDTTPSADSNYQGQYQAEGSADQNQSLEQYRALLGADSNNEPAYSDSSELENQMAAVVGQGGNAATSHAESTPPSSTPPATTGAAKGKPGAKKKPQLTRKQSSISPENADGKQQQAANLAASQPPSDSDFDISSSQ